MIPDREAKSHHVNKGKGVQSTSPHRSAWLTHSTGTRSESNTHDHLTELSKSKGDDHDIKKHVGGVEISSNDFGYSKGIKDLDLTMSLKKPNSQSFPFFNHVFLGQEHGETRGMQALGPQISHEKLTGSSNVECHLQPTEQVKYHMFFGESSSHPSDQGAYKLDSHTTHGTDNFCHLAATFASKDHSPKSGNTETEMPSFLRQNNTDFLKINASTSGHRSPAFIEEQYTRMQKHIGSGFFPHQIGEIHSFYRTKHSLLITNQTDVKGNCSPPHFSQGQGGVKIQLLDSSDHESHENVEDVKASGNVQKNESSADTDSMDMESFKEKHLSGVHLSPLNKDIVVKSNLPILPSLTSSTDKDTRRKHKIELPDINSKIPVIPASSTSIEKAEPSPSRTQTLDMNTPQLNLDHTTNSESDECSRSNPGSEPGYRWIKRLKLTATSKPASCNAGECSRSFSGCNDITLSHSWIQRWSYNQNQKNLETVENNPETSRFANGEFQKKQFPSIAAMALMGKAMTSFRQCKFHKKEAFVVWNTKAFE